MKEYRDGPVPDERRSCTDLLCLIILIAFTLVMLGFGVYSWTSSNFKKLTTPYDPDGKGCGLDYPSYPYIYFASPHPDSLWVTVCVSQCPTKNSTSLQCQPNSVVKSCQPVSNSDDTKSVQIYDSSPTAGVVCLPISDIIEQDIASALGGSASSLITNVSQNYTLILIALPIAIILSLIFMLFVRCTAGCFIYILIFLVVGSLIALGVYLLIGSSDLGNYFTLLGNSTGKTIIGVIFIILGLLILLGFCCFKKRIALASSILKVSASFVSSNCLIILLPFVLFIVMILFLALWIFQALGFYSLGTAVNEPQQLPFQHFTLSTSLQILLVVHVFYLFWVFMFLVETGDFIINGTACSWYFKRQSPYSQSSRRYRGYHIGSVCLGSFFVALIGFIKFLYQLLNPEKKDNPSGCLTNYIKFCECICCLCVSYLFQCFNDGAYTVIHVTGDAYCKSAGKALSLRIDNLATSVVVAQLQIIFGVLIRVGITALTVLVIYLIIQYVPSYNSSVTDPTLILVLVGFVAFTISCFFLSVYSEAIESIYITYLLDVEAGGKLDLCPQELKDFLADAEKDAHIIQE